MKIRVVRENGGDRGQRLTERRTWAGRQFGQAGDQLSRR